MAKVVEEPGIKGKGWIEKKKKDKKDNDQRILIQRTVHTCRTKQQVIDNIL